MRTADFTRYIGKEESLRADGIRIYGPGANAAQDFEPEYIGVSPDSRKAYVTLQENNAIAVVDIASAKVTALMPLGTKDLSTPANTIATYEWPSNALPSIGATKAGQVLRLGGFSGLAFEGVTADGKLEFITNTDRGPNAEPTATAQRPFLLPQFTPRLARFTLDPANGRFELREQILLKDYNGRPLTGLPNTAVAGGVPETPYNDEVPIDLHGKTLPLDRLGGDFEGIAVDEDGSFWLPDEYRPAIYHFNPNGRLLERFIPIGPHAAAGEDAGGSKAGQLGTEALPAGVLRSAARIAAWKRSRCATARCMRSCRARSATPLRWLTARSTPCATYVSSSSIRLRLPRGSSCTSWTIRPPCPVPPTLARTRSVTWRWCRAAAFSRSSVTTTPSTRTTSVHHQEDLRIRSRRAGHQLARHAIHRWWRRSRWTR